MAAVGWGGMLLGIKLVILSHRSDLSGAAAERLREFGVVTLFNLVFITGIGAAVAYLSFWLVRTEEEQQTWVAVTIFFSIMLTYASMALAPLHVSRPAVARLLGLVGRERSMEVVRRRW